MNWHSAYVLLLTLGSLLGFLPSVVSGQQNQTPLTILHISDLHLSVHSELHYEDFGDRHADLIQFAKTLLPRLHPLAAVLFTGDLTDAKDPYGAPLQQQQEWKELYKGVLDAFSSNGVDEAKIYDVRGNHDVFNLIGGRGGEQDHYSIHSAEGKRTSAAHQRTFMAHLYYNNTSDTQGSSAWLANTADAINIFLKRKKARSTLENSLLDCPAAILYGIDASLEPGLKSPINFLGHATPELITVVENELEQALSPDAWPEYCGFPPPIIAYGHYPLSTIATRTPASSHGPTLYSALDNAFGGSLKSAQHGLARALIDHGASVYLCGHLHTAFGERLHTLHSSALAELEAGAWKDDRRIRLLTVDGGAVSFVDLYYHGSDSPRRRFRSDGEFIRESKAWQSMKKQRGWALTSGDQHAEILHAVPMMTYPPDARYTPRGIQSTSTTFSEQKGLVRVQVVDLDDAKESQTVKVTVTVRQLNGGPVLMQRDLEPVPSITGNNKHLKLYQGIVHTMVFCQTSSGTSSSCSSSSSHHPFVHVQIEASTPESTTTSISQVYTVAWICEKQEETRQMCFVGPPPPELVSDQAAQQPSLGVSVLEWFTLTIHWPTFVHLIYFFAWSIQFGLFLVLPRRVMAQYKGRILSSTTLVNSSVTTSPMSSSQHGPISRLGRAIIGFIAWPFAALVLLASVSKAYWALVLYSLYILMMPLMIVELQTGQPLALVFHYGVLGRFHPGIDSGQDTPIHMLGSWEFIPTADTLLIALSHLLLVVIPTTLWLACVYGTRVAILHGVVSSTKQNRRVLGLTRGQLLALVALITINCKVLYIRAVQLLGPMVMIAGPGFGWTIPLALILLVLVPGGSDLCNRRKGSPTLSNAERGGTKGE